MAKHCREINKLSRKITNKSGGKAISKPSLAYINEAYEEALIREVAETEILLR